MSINFRLLKNRANYSSRWFSSIAIIVLLVSKFLLCNIVLAADFSDSGVEELSDIEVTEEYDSSTRIYSQKSGKKFFTEVYGNAKSILAIAEQTKVNGHRDVVNVRYLSMPQGHVGSYIPIYEYTFPNGKTFLYLESGKFKALAFETNFGSVVIDTLEGSAFASPMLWGPYDQVAGSDRTYMQMMIGDGGKDNMGAMKSSYLIGEMAIMEEEDYIFYGKVYADAILDTIKYF